MIVCSCTAVSDRFVTAVIADRPEDIAKKSSLGSAAAFVHREARKMAGIKKKGSCLQCFETVASMIRNAGLFEKTEFSPAEQTAAERCASCDGTGACANIPQF